MEIEKLQGMVEAILFTMGESVELSKIAAAIQHDEETTRKMIHNMMDRYEEDNRGIHIIELENSFQMCTKPEAYEYLVRVAKQPKKYVLTEVLLETLSIIAYKQPVTKGEIESVRGIRCDRVIEGLIKKKLIAEVGRSSTVGRPLLYGTTDEFLKQFGFETLKDLPDIEDIEGVMSEENGDTADPDSLMMQQISIELPEGN